MPRGHHQGRHGRTAILIAASLVSVAMIDLSSQTRPPAVRKPAPASNQRTAPAEMICPSQLGLGVKTQLAFCDVLTGREPAGGVIIKLPPHRGAVTLTFDLHNRQVYSEEQVRARRAFAHYIATIGVLAMDNTLISRAVVDSEFRTADDLIDRISGGAGAEGLKAVAPTGVSKVSITIPEREQEVSLLGEKLTVERADGTATYTSAGRPIAVISNVMVTYRPGPAPRAVRKPAPAKK